MKGSKEKTWWNPKRAKAAQMVADGKTEEQVCNELGIGNATLFRWKSEQVFKDRIAEITQQTATALKSQGIRIREARLNRLEELFDRINGTIRARAETFANDPEAIGQGGENGLIVKDYKGQVLPRAVFKFDAALAKEYRETLKHIAQELGEWTEKQEITGKDGESLLRPLSDALEKIYGDTEKPESKAN